MHEERKEILEMLSEGKITAEEAERLLKALPGKRPGRGRWPGLDWIASLFGAGAEYSEQQDWTLDAAGVSLIKTQTDNGSILLRGSDQDQVTVHAWKKVRAPSETAAEEFAQQVQVHVERNENEIHIYKEHPRPPIGTSVAVRYEISSPRAIDANLRTANGSIKVHEIDGAVEAVSSNGAIELQGGAGNVNLRTSNGAVQLQDATGHIHVETSNGRIAASVGQLEEGIFTTTNGAIRMTLPADFSGQLDARTSHGRVHSELPVSGVEGARKNHLVGQIGEGGETTIELRTLNGSIHVKAQ